jgi:hypothetical protein
MTGATVAILDVGAMHVGSDQQAGGVCNKLTLAAFDFLATSRPRGPPASVVFDRLTVKTPAEGLGSRPAASRACSSSSEIDPLQHPAVPPSQEIMLNHRIAGISRQWPPWAAFRGRPSPCSSGQPRLDYRPLGIAQNV